MIAIVLAWAADALLSREHLAGWRAYGAAL